MVDGYEILRMETDLVAAMPEIRLAADHIAVEYGPVVFHKGTTKMWLPRSAPDGRLIRKWNTLTAADLEQFLGELQRASGARAG